MVRQFAPSLAAPALALALALAAAPAAANDSEAEWAVGGLALKPNDQISMDREDLFISAEEIRVDYVFTNHSALPQTVLVSFPLPPLPGESEFFEYYSYPDWERLGFSTMIDGQPAEWEIATRAMIDGRDATAQVLAEGLPLAWYNTPEFLYSLSQGDRSRADRLVAEGLLTYDMPGDYYIPRWQMQQHVTRQQTFPAGASVRVAHRYAPIAGGSVAGGLYRTIREESPEVLAHYRERYCVDDTFLKGFDRRDAEESRRSAEYASPYGETWIGYILSSGANWRGPIGDFRLVVDKGKPENLVSFCMDGVSKIGPTRFEVRKTDYEPDRDLNILIVEWYRFEE